MDIWQKIILELIVVCLIGLFWWLIQQKKKEFDASMLGLITLPIAIILIMVIDPDSIKLGDLELKKIKQEAKSATEEAKQANRRAQETILEAQKAVRLAIESSAMVTWNAAEVGNAPEKVESKQRADMFLKKIYGKDAVEYRKYLQKEGIFYATPAEKATLKNVEKPVWIESPIFENLKGFGNSESVLQK